MKAWVLHGINDIRFEDVPIPKPGPGEVLMRVRAAGICGSDIPRIFDTGAHRMPLIPGHEFAGEVTETGAGVDGSWLGKRVGVFPLIPCGKCSQCKAGAYEMCRDYDYIGSRRDGAFTEYVTVPAANLIEIPENVSYEAAAMSEPMAVAAHAIRRVTDAGKVTDHGSRDKGIAVYGLGTIGMLITLLLKAEGYDNLCLIGNTDGQRDKIMSMGISGDRYYDNSENKAAARLTEAGGADIVFECVGKSQTCAEAINIASPSGKVVLVGNPYSDMTLPRDIYWRILRNQLMVSGTWNSSFTLNGVNAGGTPEDDDWRYIYKLLAAGTVDPTCLITHRYPLDSLKSGLDIMRSRSEEYIKIMTGE